jgi:hypothetical protein
MQYSKPKKMKKFTNRKPKIKNNQLNLIFESQLVFLPILYQLNAIPTVQSRRTLDFAKEYSVFKNPFLKHFG